MPPPCRAGICWYWPAPPERSVRGVIRPRCGGSARALPAARVRGANPRPRGDRRIAAPGVPPNSVSDRCGRLLTYDQVHGMSRHMAERTTVRLPEDLLNRAKRKAAAEGRTLTSLIEDGLRLIVADNQRGTKRNRVQPRISKATGGPMPRIELTD